MKAALLALAALLTLASCGADGAPTPPAATPAIGVSGEVQIGVTS